MATNNPRLFEDFFSGRTADSAKVNEELCVLVDSYRRKAVESGLVLKTDEELKKYIEDNVAKQTTIFPRDEKGLFMYDYQLRGFFKEQVGAMIELGDLNLSKWSHKKAVDQYLLVESRRNYFTRDGQIIAKADSELQRPLRVMTMQGERVSLANSEAIEPSKGGAQLTFVTKALLPSKATKGDDDEGGKKVTKKRDCIAIFDRETLASCVEFGALHGFGQWRSGGYGKFTFVHEPVN